MQPQKKVYNISEDFQLLLRKYYPGLSNKDHTLVTSKYRA